VKILLATPTVDQSVGGIARSTPELALALQRQGLSLTLLAPQPAHAVETVTSLDCESSFFSGLIAGAPQAAWKRELNEFILNSKKPEVIHLAGLWLPFSRAVVGLAKGEEIPLILSPRGMLEPWALNSKKWKKKLAWTLYQKRDLEKATAFHATARSEADSIRRLGFKQPIAIIPNGVHLPQITTDQPKTGEPKTEEKTALFLSRINPKKGLPMLLDAWAKLAPADWRLVIAGNDDSHHLPVVERKVRELGLGERVEIAGPLFGAAKEAAYRHADLFVLPSYSENFGIVVAEAMGYGLPVLTTTGCPWQELQTHNCGWWVEPTPAGIERGLNEALSTKNEALSEMGLRGRKLVEEKYQWPGIAERMLEFYEWVLHGGERPDFVV